MADLMRTSNPALTSQAFQGEGVGTGEAMTVQGTVNKTGLLLLCVVATAAWTWNVFMKSGNPQAVMPMLLIGGIGGFIFALITIFKKTWAPVTAPVYALLEGMVLGGISAMFEVRYPGIAIQAVSLTFGTMFALLLAYRSGLIPVTENFKLGIVAATGGIALFYLAQMLLGFFGIHFTTINGSGSIGIAFSFFVVACRGAESGAGLRLHRARRASRRAQVHGVVRRLRHHRHAGLALSGDSAAAFEDAQQKLNGILNRPGARIPRAKCQNLPK